MTPTRRTTRLRRLLAGVAGLALLGGAALVPSVPETDAAWTDAEVGTAAFTAATLAPPVIQESIDPCSRALLGGNVLGLRWAYPQVTGLYSEFDIDNAEWRVNDGAWQSIAPVTTGPDQAGKYMTSISRGILDGLLGGLAEILLGGSFTVDLRTTDGETWLSSSTSRVTYSASPLQSPVCTVQNGG